VLCYIGEVHVHCNYFGCEQKHNVTDPSIIRSDEWQRERLAYTLICPEREQEMEKCVKIAAIELSTRKRRQCCDR
jgi:hypothetical protein